MPEICPSLFIIEPQEPTNPYHNNDIFRPDGFRVLQAESLTRIKEIIAMTTALGQALKVRLLCCYRMKSLPETYCTHRFVDDTEKRICSSVTGIKTNFLHFHIHGEMTNLNCNEYFLAFIEGSDLCKNINILVNELFCSIAWLGIDSSKIFLNVFTFGHPVYGTGNISNSLEELINSTKQTTHEYTGNIECKITHINKNFENYLSVYLKDKYLAFGPS
jgi:hypothetical protein